jgi:uroporphyrinogen decarboxylase
MTTEEPNTGPFNRRVLASPLRLAMPIATYPGLALIGATVHDIVTNPGAQLDAQAALHNRYGTSFLLTAMDLSAEAEAFGCAIQLSESEVPTVTGRRVTSLADAQSLAVPEVGDKRTGVYLEAARGLRKNSGDALVLGGCIGPFSLAARLAGVSEAMELTVTEPDLMHTLIEKSTAFLTAYVQAFKRAGADGLIMAEPAAGLLSPRGLATFSSAYVKSIAGAVVDEQFTLILHNCGAKLLHLPAILETGLKTFHFGAPMDLPGALAKVAPDVVLCGNLDPAGVFCQLTAAEVSARTAALLKAGSAYRNYVISSGCDVPPNAPLANLDAFYAAVSAQAT